MKLHTKNHAIKTGGIGEATAFTVSASPKMMEILSNGLYSDKILAVVRELSTNAWDAHQDAGTTDRPFRIHAPNRLEPYFEIRDYGVGLSHEDMLTLYTSYGESTKDQSNDAIGALGLGSKSPFAYVSQFTVRSFFNGKVRTYTCFKNEAGLPSIAEVGEPQNTDEHNGLLIQVPVQLDDCYTFQRKIRRALRYFTVKPELVGVEPEFQIEEIKYCERGNGWAVREINDDGYGYRNQDCYAIQGFIPYRIDENRIEGLSEEERFILRGTPIDMFFEIGELDIAANREDLGYNQPTQDRIRKKVGEILQIVKAEIAAKFTNCQTLWEAKKLYGEMFGRSRYGSNQGSSPWARLINCGKFSVGFNGVDIEEAQFEFDLRDFCKVTTKKSKVPGTPDISVVEDKDDITMTQYTRSRGTKAKFRQFKHHRSHSNHVIKINPCDKLVIVWHNFDRIQAAAKRVERLLDETDVEEIYFFRCSEESLNRIQKELGDVEIGKMEDLPKPDRVKTPAEKTNCYIFVRDPSRGWRETPKTADYWEKSSIDLKNDGGFYIPVHRKVPLLDPENVESNLGLHKFNGLVKAATNAGIIKDDTVIVGLPPAQVRQVKKSRSWANLFDKIRESAVRYLNDIKNQQTDADERAYQRFISIEASSGQVEVLAEIAQRAKSASNPITVFCNAFEAMKKAKVSTHISEIARILQIEITHDCQASHDLTDLWDNVEQSFPMITFVINTHRPSSDEKQRAADYIDQQIQFHRLRSAIAV